MVKERSCQQDPDAIQWRLGTHLNKALPLRRLQSNQRLWGVFGRLLWRQTLCPEGRLPLHPPLCQQAILPQFLPGHLPPCFCKIPCCCQINGVGAIQSFKSYHNKVLITAGKYPFGLPQSLFGRFCPTNLITEIPQSCEVAPVFKPSSMITKYHTHLIRYISVIYAVSESPWNTISWRVVNHEWPRESSILQGIWHFTGYCSLKLCTPDTGSCTSWWCPA